MTYFYIVKDGKIEARTTTKERAIDLIRQHQELEKHPFLRAEFTIIEGKAEETIKYI